MLSGCNRAADSSVYKSRRLPPLARKDRSLSPLTPAGRLWSSRKRSSHFFRGLAGRTHPGPCLYVKSAGTPGVVRCSELHALRAAKKEPRASHIHMESHKAPPGRTPGTSRPRHKQKATTLCTCTTSDVSDASSKDARETPPDARGNVRDASEDVQDARENLQDARENLPTSLGWWMNSTASRPAIVTCHADDR